MQLLTLYLLSEWLLEVFCHNKLLLSFCLDFKLLTTHYKSQEKGFFIFTFQIYRQ